MKQQTTMLVTGGDPAEIFSPVPSEESFEDSDFIDAAEVEAIGAALIKHRAGLEYLREHPIEYLWQRKGGSSRGKPVLARCRRPKGLLAMYCDAHFIVTASADHLTKARLTRYQMEALIYHELCHTNVDVEKGPCLVPHDFEGFNAEVTIYGAWYPDLEKAALAFKQLSFAL